MSGWDEWDTGSTPPQPAQPVGRVARKQQARERAQQARSATAARKRRVLADLEHAPGLLVLAGAVLIVGIVLWANLSGNDEQQQSQPPANDSSDVAAPTSSAPAIGMDPHAGVAVLNPRSMPPAPGEPDASASTSATTAAVAFAAQACALNGGESRAQYEARLLPLSSPQVATAWQVGSAQRIACMQLAGQVTAESKESASVSVSGVQVYSDASAPDGMRAYRWSADLEVTKDGQAWTVSAA